MIDYPQLREQPSSRQILDVFRGYNRNLRIGEGEFRDMENLTSDHYPVLSPRKKRSTVFDINNLPAGERPHEGKLTGVVCTSQWGIMYTQGPNLYRWYYPNSPIPLELNDEPKRFVFMGQYLIILPDMKYVKLDKYLNDYGSLSHWAEISEGTATFELCDVDGKAYSGATVSDTAPGSPKNLALWIDTSSNPHVLKQYSASSDMWATVTATYVKIKAPANDGRIYWFDEHDGVTISGIRAEGALDLNGSTTIWKRGANYIVVPGMLDKTVTQDCGTDRAIRIERKVPVMDYVVEAGNRLWGCRYGENGDGKFVNEIYATELGDFKNWNCFMGVSTDSWVGSVGSQGPFTGAANVGGYPVFYKENIKHKVWISETGAHQITSIPCQGVARHDVDSVATIDGMAIYRSPRGFCIDDGTMPVEIGQCFAGMGYSEAIGCVCGRKYYVSMIDDDYKWHLFVYDVDKKLWHREDDFHAISFAASTDALFAIDADGETLFNMSNEASQGKGSEESVKWMAETGELGLSSPDMKYVSRLTLRLSMEVGAELTVYALYDMEPEWVPLFSIRGTDLRSFSLPVSPRRCDYLRLRFEGVGDVKLYSITKTIEEGSEQS